MLIILALGIPVFGTNAYDHTVLNTMLLPLSLFHHAENGCQVVCCRRSLSLDHGLPVPAFGTWRLDWSAVPLGMVKLLLGIEVLIEEDTIPQLTRGVEAVLGHSANDSVVQLKEDCLGNTATFRLCHQERLPLPDGLTMQSLHQHHGPAPVAVLGADEEALDAGAEGARLRVWHGEHDDADELVALGLGPRVGLVEQDDDDPRADLGLGDPVLPPGQELLVAERGHEEADHPVVRDALGLEAGEPWGQVGVRDRVEEVGLCAAVHHHGGLLLLLLWHAIWPGIRRRN